MGNAIASGKLAGLEVLAPDLLAASDGEKNLVMDVCLEGRRTEVRKGAMPLMFQAKMRRTEGSWGWRVLDEVELEVSGER